MSDITFTVGCTKCASCADVCPVKIFRLNKESSVMEVRAERSGLCIRCGHCMAVCPRQSVNVEGLSYTEDFFELPDARDHGKDFFELIASRRSVRNFKDKPVPVTELEKIVRAISFAPPPFPPHKVELIVVQNTDMIRKSLPHMIEFYDFMIKAFKNPFIKHAIRKEAGKKKFLTLSGHLLPLMKARMADLKSGKEDSITRDAPAMILFLADRNAEDVSAEIYIAQTYAMLAAHSIGLGCTVMDIIPPAIERRSELRMLFGVDADKEAAGAVIIGYPKYRFRRGISREIKNVKWIR